MLPESIELVIVTPERQLLRQTVVEVTLPGGDGCLGVLPGHAPLITELGIGELTYRAKEAKKRAEQRLATASSDPNVDWARAAIALQRSLIRIQVARKRHGAPVS